MAQGGEGDRPGDPTLQDGAWAAARDSQETVVAPSCVESCVNKCDGCVHYEVLELGHGSRTRDPSPACRRGGDSE